MTTGAGMGTEVVAWPLARRVVTGLAQPGGPAMAARAFDAAGLDDGSRVVELTPGAGIATEAVLARDPRTWTGVDPDPLAVEHLRKSRVVRKGLPIPGREAPSRTRRVVQAPPDATGLEDESATVVVADALMSVQPGPEARRAILAEAARLLRSGGRVAIHDLTWAEDADDAARDDLLAAGIRPLSPAELRADLDAVGLAAVGSLVGPLHLPAAKDVAREAGPRSGLKVTREIALGAGLRQAALAGKEALPRRAVALRSVVVVGELPLILGFRRPRR